MNANNRLLVDKHCPMCHWYSGQFVKRGFLAPEGVAYYQTISKEITNHVDMEKAKAEIALHDIKAKRTLYGIDAIINIVSNRKPILEKILKSSLVYWFLKLLYKFISHNRKIIYPTAQMAGERDCTPPVNIRMRWTYIAFVALFTALVLNEFSSLIFTYFGLKNNLLTELLICFGQVAWQASVLFLFRKGKFLEYLGNMSTVSLIGAIVLIPYLLLVPIIGFNIWLHLIYFGIVVSMMLIEHLRRCSLIGLPWTMSLSWVLYRMFVLSLILLPFII